MSSLSGADDEGPAMRARYTEQEDKKILDYIIRNRLFSRVKGKAMWEGMEIALRREVKGRTWLSLKERYTKYIVPIINDYNIDPKIIRHILEPFHMQGGVIESPKKDSKTIRRYYSNSEDKKLIKIVCKINGNICGNKMWKIIEQRNILEGRSWSSLRNRFLNNIVENLDSLTDAETADLIRRRMSGDVNTETVEESHSGEQQEVRKRSPTKKSIRPLPPLGFQELFKSRDTPQRVEARLASVNLTRRNAQKPQPGPSSQSNSNSESLAPSFRRKKETIPSTASSGERPAKRLPSESFESSFHSRAVAATSTPVAAGQARIADSEDCTSPKKNRRRDADDAVRVADPLLEEDSAVVGDDSSPELIACNSDSSAEEEDESDDDVETFIDPLYVDFVDKACMPFVVVNGTKIKLNHLEFPIVDVF